MNCLANKSTGITLFFHRIAFKNFGVFLEIIEGLLTGLRDKALNVPKNKCNNHTRFLDSITNDGSDSAEGGHNGLVRIGARFRHGGTLADPAAFRYSAARRRAASDSVASDLEKVKRTKRAPASASR